MDPSQFLAALWGENPPGMVNVFTLPERKSSWYSELTSVNRDMQQHLHKEVYTGVALARNLGGRFNTQRRVKEVDAAAIPGVWADIDVFHQVHKKKENLPPTAEAAQEVMAELPYEPTLIVDSGHGLQYWWLLENPWVFSGQKEWEQARRVTQWWHKSINDLFEDKGWVADSVFDLSRIMRVPGTWNNKDPGDRKPVVAIKTDGPRFTIEDFLGLVPPDFVASPPVAEQVATGGSRAGTKGLESKVATAYHSELTIASDAQPNPVRLEAFLKAAPAFRLTWERKRSDLRDQSASGYNMSIACYCVQAGWPDQDVVNAMVYWRALHKEDLKLLGSYYARTLAKAKRFIEENRSGRPPVDSVSKTSQREEPGGESVSDPKERLQRVRLTNDEGRNIEDCVLAVKLLNDPPTLLSISNGKGIGVITSPDGKIEMQYCAAERTHLEITRRVQFTKVTGKGIEVPATPAVTLMNLLHRALPPEIPPFNGFKRTPFLWDGSLVTSAGYHAESGYYVDVPAGLNLDLSVESALAVIDEFFGGFPFQGLADKASAYSFILGFPLKPLGNAPGIFVDKPASQTGASLLCRCLAWVISGRTPVLVTQGRSVGELDKRLITKLKDQPDSIILDNLNGQLESDMVASGMTDDFFGSRLLSVNADALVPTRSLGLMFTGNNLTATRELQNRCFRCRLDANHPHPETRTNFPHKLPADVVTHRVTIVSAVSSIVQRWIEEGMPQGNPLLGSFIPYTEALSGLMAFAGMPKLDANRGAMVNDTTPSWENLDTLILRWWEKHEAEPVRAIDLLDLAEELDLKGDTERRLATSLSRRLGHALGQVFDVEDGILVKLIESGRDKKGRAKQGLRYRLIRV